MTTTLPPAVVADLVATAATYRSATRDLPMDEIDRARGEQLDLALVAYYTAELDAHLALPPFLAPRVNGGTR